ncbi:nitrogenase cofactor biosynthesis protein NifB [Desulfoferula mesophila]|uniref:FeMo cofactor biosynthesis protein NifB n=1 Tax=Desulfoferula mesophila TaxID=3058419 RepID=A0AAU9ED93_9BACT|nr:nitrogenase cofactor biosynthesis protein NifB [Desulfoferula mesophilus]
MSIPNNSENHPCFNRGAKGSHGRVHLPVAPACNIKCNYCDRKYSCVNESRPGVTSAVLAPRQAQEYFARVVAAEPRISVAGIAGPGDPMANAAKTLQTMRLIGERFPGTLLCLSSNGLAVPEHLDALADSGVTHMTITVNAVDPAIGAKIYSWVKEGKVAYRGEEAARLLLERQTQAVAGLKERGITVKINSIVIPTINDGHMTEVARWASELGADLMNLMPMFPTPNTVFEALGEPSRELMQQLRSDCAPYLNQMSHCTRCRADAVGLLGQDRSREMGGCLSSCTKLPEPKEVSHPYVAVATREGTLVNLHLGQAPEFQIWGPIPGGFSLLEVRPAPEAGGGELRWKKLAETLSDCRHVLVSGIGETPRAVLSGYGVEPLEVSGFIEETLKAIYAGDDLSAFRIRKGKACCAEKMGSGGGMGCM